jgi:predicted nucleic acid-binding protein
MVHYFFDTSALKHRYIKSPQHARICKITSDKRNSCYICDFTILEMASALGSVCRDTNAGIKKYDSMNSRFFEDIHTGRIQVRTTTWVSTLRARNLLRFGGVILGAPFGSADALIASTCLDLAHELKVRFRFYTGDWELYRLLRQIDVFKAGMILQYIFPPRQGILARTG